MEVTRVIVRKTFDEGPVKAVVSIILDEDFAIHDVKIVETSDKTFIVMPSKVTPNGDHKDIAHPINTEARLKVENAVKEAYLKEIENKAENKDTVSE